MKPSNNPDIALAQEWIAHLDAYLDKHSLKGFDPFDVKAHPRIRAAQTNYFLRKTTSLFTDMFPYASRKLLNIEPTENAKAYALCALGDMRLEKLTGDTRLRDRAQSRLTWLLDHTIPNLEHPCWGYPFGFSGTGIDVPANTPITVVTAIVGFAFLEAHVQYGGQKYLDTALGAAHIIMNDMPRLDESGDAFCFAYATCDQRRVHNANLLGAELLIRAGDATQDTAMLEAGKKALQYTLSRQQENGAWAYGEYTEGEPYEPALMQLVDHHHTGFVLRSLHGIYIATKDEEVKHALQKGFNFYKTLFTDIGQPLTAQGAWPVDIHACTEGILCPAVISETVFGSKKYALLTLRWTHFFMRDPKTDLPYYRKYPWFTSKLMPTRWGLAWLYYALAEYLSQFYEEE